MNFLAYLIKPNLLMEKASWVDVSVLASGELFRRAFLTIDGATVEASITSS